MNGAGAHTDPIQSILQELRLLRGEVAMLREVVGERMVSKAEAAEILGCSTRTLDRRADDGVIFPVRIGKYVKYPTSEVQRIKREGLV